MALTSAPPSGVGRLVRWHGASLGLLALAAAGGQAAASLLHGPLWLAAGLPLLTGAGLGAAAFGPGRLRQTLDTLRVAEARQADQDAALAEADQQMAEMRHLMDNLSTLDALTGMRNHRAFYEQLEIEMGRALRHSSPLSLLLLDVDQFKSYNDRYGHPSGDTALKQIADVIREHTRATDILARFGGKQFAVILTETDMMGSVVLGERLRQAVSGMGTLHRPLTVSIGLTTLALGMGGVAGMIAQADRALCAAKGEGRNRVSHADRLPTVADEQKPSFAYAA